VSSEALRRPIDNGDLNLYPPRMKATSVSFSSTRRIAESLQHTCAGSGNKFGRFVLHGPIGSPACGFANEPTCGGGFQNLQGCNRTEMGPD
jgi:hypothetical protein